MGHPSDKQQSSRASHGEWLVNVADDVVAPMTTLEVIDALRKGRLSEQSLVWRVGMHDWTAVLDVPQLRLAASSRPPPPAVPPPTQITAVAPRNHEQADASAQDMNSATAENSAEYLDSPDHFESVDDAELEDSEPVTTLMRESTAPIESSLAPTTAEASASARAPGTWEGIDELLSSEQRAEQQHTRRVVLWAAIGSAILAAAFTLLMVHSKARDESPPPSTAEQASREPPLTALPIPSPVTTTEAAPRPSASAVERAPAPPRPAPKWGAPRFAKRPKRGVPITPTVDVPADTASDAPDSASTVAAVPAAATPAATASVSTPATSAPSSESP